MTVECHHANCHRHEAKLTRVTVGADSGTHCTSGHAFGPGDRVCAGQC